MTLLEDLAKLWQMLGESSEWLLSRYCFPKKILMGLCCDLGPFLERQTSHMNPIPVQIQLLSALGFFATGTFQREIGSVGSVGISQPTLSQIMPSVLDAIISLSPKYIQFPWTNQQQVIIKQEFYTIVGFPNTIGALDCTLIAIKTPSQYKFYYVNRKGFHSIKVQIIADSHLNILNFVARWPGGTHNSFIVRNSSVGVRLDRGNDEDGWHIGECDSYALKPWLMTPIPNPATVQEQNYNRAHVQTRSTVECVICLLKCRWLCLSSIRGTLQYQPEKVCHIIMARCVLHNLAIRQGIPLQESPIPDPPMPDADSVLYRLLIAGFLLYLDFAYSITSGLSLWCILT
uniref:Putative nuclease HARBI1 n=1 Tax=Paramormyrops kingsleyae TaxID=1676925 RepID=A0A3B3SB28_9TELE